MADGLRADYRARGRRSLDRAELALTHLSNAFAHAKAPDITVARIASYLSERIESGAARATVHYELSVLKRAFRLAVRRSALAVVPVFPEMGDLHNAREGFFTEADLAALQLELPEYLRPLAEFAFLTGFRKREILTLQWSDVDLDAHIIRLEGSRTKSGHAREFPFARYDALRALLEREREHTDTVEQRSGKLVPFVFHRDGRPIKDCYAAWRAACKRAGLAGRHLHDMRRSAVRAMVRAGIPKHTAMQLSGHRTANIFDRYDIHETRDLEDATAKLAGSRADPTPAKTTWDS